MKSGFDEKAFVFDIYRLREEQFLKQLEVYEEQIAPMMRQQGYKRVDQVERRVIFTFGDITFSRSRWRKGSKTRYPV
ncbi:ISLre2 family transposase, partial [Streptococcus pluranimalium]